MNFKKRIAAVAAAFAVTFTAFSSLPLDSANLVDAAASVDMEWGTLRIGGGGFVSGIVTGKKAMYARTDVGGCYRYNYDTESWEQLLGFLTEADRGLLSVDAMAIDPTDDDTVYFLCGCAYFSNEKTVIFKTTDGGKTFKEINVSDEIKVMGNGDGRQCGESIAVNPDNPKEIYAGGDVAFGKSALIKSTDGGETWKPVIGYDELGLFSETTKWPTWTDNIARSVTADAYNNQNGVAAITISNGKVYVGTSAKGVQNVHVASVKDDKFEVLSEDLPYENYPSRVNVDANGDVIISYIAGLAFSGAAGGAYKYEVKTGKVTDISPCGNSIGQIYTDPNNPDRMIATTCGVWSSQQYTEDAWDRDKVAWGDQFFRSVDGGKTWEKITPGVTKSWGGPLQADYIQDGGYEWIRDKAIHWVGSFVLDPRDDSRAFLTSGNGSFVCTDIWGELPVYTFHPDGIEEVVSLDFVSVPGGANYSAIGDYDGFIHNDTSSIPPQYTPNMGSTSAIAYCPSNPDIMARTANGDGNNTGSGYYSTDAGKTWTAFTPKYTGGKLSITETATGKYRIINSSSTGGVCYTDDYGKTWKESTGIKASKGAYTLVDLNNPKIVYASGADHNDYWSSDMTKKEPTIDESHYSLFVSNDYGATFTETRVCMYGWESAGNYTHTGDLAYLSEGTVAMACDKYGVYIFSENGTKMTHLDNVAYAKSIGYGAPEKEGNPNTLFIYGRPGENDPEGIYRSTDSGKTWVCINTDHLYGGTGNGNYLVGDMNEFGTVYMSTVGCGIVYGKLASGTTDVKDPAVTTTEPASSKDDIMYGDVNGDKKIELSDLTALSLYLVGEKTLSANNKLAADVDANSDINLADLALLKQYISHDEVTLGPKKK